MGIMKWWRYGTDGNTVDDSLNIGVGQLPGRKQTALYLCEDAEVRPIAYFKDHADAERVSQLFRDIVKSRGYLK